MNEPTQKSTPIPLSRSPDPNWKPAGMNRDHPWVSGKGSSDTVEGMEELSEGQVPLPDVKDLDLGEKVQPARDYYKLGDFASDYLDSDLIENLDSIDSLARTFIEDIGWQPTVSSYQKALSQLEKDLDLTDETLTINRIAKLSDIAQHFNKIAEKTFQKKRTELWSKIVKASKKLDVGELILKALEKQVDDSEKPKPKKKKTKTKKTKRKKKKGNDVDLEGMIQSTALKAVFGEN